MHVARVRKHTDMRELHALRNVQKKCDTNHIPRATAYGPGGRVGWLAGWASGMGMCGGGQGGVCSGGPGGGWLGRAGWVG